MIVSRAVTDRVTGSGSQFRERGSAAPEGAPGDRQLFAVSGTGAWLSALRAASGAGGMLRRWPLAGP
ncbi:MAG: adenylate/guanylate cyclase domain-containing protein, partial [Thermoleophilia bacterium]|nr:adenylate/guanylate cyclase domain-containing protein [Thermoleophilia bacterium]